MHLGALYLHCHPGLLSCSHCSRWTRSPDRLRLAGCDDDNDDEEYDDVDEEDDDNIAEEEDDNVDEEEDDSVDDEKNDNVDEEEDYGVDEDLLNKSERQSFIIIITTQIFWQTTYFVPTCCFLLYNIGDFMGR